MQLNFSITSNKLIFCDTNILTTIAWSKTHYDGFCDPWLIRQSKSLKYDYYLILNIDTPWIKDDLRDRPDERLEMFKATGNAPPIYSSFFKKLTDKIFSFEGVPNGVE